MIVIDDERRLVELIVSYLEETGHVASGFFDGVSGLNAASDPDVDAVVLDLMLPRLGGLEVCRALRKVRQDVLIIILTARGAVSERVAGLDAGADDYLVKPFALEELSARLRAIRRRTKQVGEDVDARLVVGELVLDTQEQRVWRGDTELDLPRRELAVLQALMENPGHVVSRSYILEEVWDGEVDIRSNVIDVHISKLRSRIDKPFGTATITTLRGVGYRIERPE